MQIALRVRVNSYKGQVLAAKSWLTTIVVYPFISLGVALAILAPTMLSATANLPAMVLLPHPNVARISIKGALA